MVVLLETKIVDHKHLTETLHFDSHLESSTTGRKEGIVIMWKEDVVKLQKFSISAQGIHTIVKVTSNLNIW